MKQLALLIILCSFFVYKPYQLQNSSLIYKGDDYSYFAHSTSLAFFEFPNYDKEIFQAGKKIPFHSIGPGIMAAPFVFIFSQIDKIIGNDIVISRKGSKTFLKSWTIFGFVFSTLFYFCLSCRLLYLALRFYYNKKVCVYAVSLTMIAQGIPLYVYRRPIFSHIYELFLQVFLIYILVKSKNSVSFFSKSCIYSKTAAVIVGFSSSMIFLVRSNNIFLAFLWPILIFTSFDKSDRTFSRLMLSIISFCATIVIFKIFPMYMNNTLFVENTNYFNHPYIKKYLFTLYGIKFYIKRAIHVLFGLDWGLIYTAPFILTGLFWIFKFQKNNIKKSLIILLIPMIPNYYILLSFRQQGAWYGYRYLLFSLIPIIIFPFSDLINHLISNNKKKLFIILLCISIFPILSMISFDGNNSVLTLKVIDQGFGITDWGNNTYQLEIYKMIFFHPIEYLKAIFKGGLLYIIYLICNLFGIVSSLPKIVLQKYQCFELTTLIKTVIIYITPLILLYRKENDS